MGTGSTAYEWPTTGAIGGFRLRSGLPVRRLHRYGDGLGSIVHGLVAEESEDESKSCRLRRKLTSRAGSQGDLKPQPGFGPPPPRCRGGNFGGPAPGASTRSRRAELIEAVKSIFDALFSRIVERGSSSQTDLGLTDAD